VEKLLGEMFPANSQVRQDVKQKLWDEAHETVQRHWEALEALARALWAKPWVERVTLPPAYMGWSRDDREKWMDGKEVQQTLQAFGLDAIVRADAHDPCAARKETNPA